MEIVSYCSCPRLPELTVTMEPKFYKLNFIISICCHHTGSNGLYNFRVQTAKEWVCYIANLPFKNCIVTYIVQLLFYVSTKILPKREFN